MTATVREPIAHAEALSDRELMAHLFRRAGFGASPEELETALERGYEATVEELLHPERVASPDMTLFFRAFPDCDPMVEARSLRANQATWLFRMITTECPLEEKMTLFWHSLFATAVSKVPTPRAVMFQIDKLRRRCLDDFAEILLEISRDPAMLYWLDNQQNTNKVHNENFGRELLELFSMGIGTYSEDDVKSCARAFTGWSLRNAIYAGPHGFNDWEFAFRADMHDAENKVFLGHEGRLDGGDIIEIIVRQPACARYISSRLYNFFVSDDPNERASERLATVFMDTGGDIRAVMRALLMSDEFRSAESYFAKVKSPVDLVVCAVRTAGGYDRPTAGRGLADVARAVGDMGQDIMNPPTVEGWHTGVEWIDSGLLVERVNFVAHQLGDPSNPGVSRLMEELRSRAITEPNEVVDACLQRVGPLPVSDATRSALVEFIERDGPIVWSPEADTKTAWRVCGVLSLIGASREYQLC